MNNSRIQNNMECRYCHEVGHVIRNCTRLKNKKSNDNFPTQRKKQPNEYVSKPEVITKELINDDDFPVLVNKLTKTDDKMNTWCNTRSFADAIKIPDVTKNESVQKHTGDIVFETL